METTGLSVLMITFLFSLAVMYFYFKELGYELFINPMLESNFFDASSKARKIRRSVVAWSLYAIGAMVALTPLIFAHYGVVKFFF